MMTDESRSGPSSRAAAWLRSAPEVARHIVGPPVGARKYAVTSAIYLGVYLALNALTSLHAFRNSSITLWSPDDGISLLLLTESIAYSPVVFVASVFVDLWTYPIDFSLRTGLVCEFILTVSYICVAAILRDSFHFNFRVANYANVVALLAVAPASAVVTGTIYCTALYGTGAIPGDKIYDAIRFFWVGDTVGMVVAIPAIMAVYDILLHRRWRTFRSGPGIVTAMLVGASIFVFDILSVGDVNNRYLFNLLFMPTIWIGINYGFSATAIMLMATQLVLIASMTYFHVEDHNFIVMQTLMFILAATGQLLGAVVSEREHATRLLRQQQAELSRTAAETASGALAVTLAHEISQPLSSVASYVHGARRLLESGQSQQSIVNALTKAEAETRRARDVIARIRDFVASGQLAVEPTDLGDLARKIIALNIDDARARNVELQLEMREPTPIVFVDRLGIEQALNNLVVNAIDSASGSSELGRVTLGAHSAGQTAYLQVDDNGAGVSVEIADRLFEAFETTKARGMGLGLPLALQIVRKHSGKLTWRPRHPRGASFVIGLPIQGPKDAKL